MIAYSKMRVSGAKSKSRSTDFSDFLVFPAEPNSGNASDLKSKAPEASHVKSTTLDYSSSISIKNSSHEEDSSCLSEQDHDHEGNKRVLRRSSSTAASSSGFFRFEMAQKSMGMESAVRRAFSMRRSSSVSERYCRIHDQSVTLLTSDMDWDEDADERTRNHGCPTKSDQKKRQHKGGKILRACRRFLRL